jgi:predicted nucleic acid-binding protein
MTNYYFDTSALVKLYITEPGSAWVNQIVYAKSNSHLLNLVFLSEIGIVETAAALARRQRMGQIDLDRRNILYRRLLEDQKNWSNIVMPTEDILHIASELTQKQPLRGYDAIHLATALQLNHTLRARGVASITFVAADDSLCQAAAAEGLHTENPNLVES